MEWDTDRAGGIEPLGLSPKGKMVVLGLVTSKTGTLESKDDLKRRINEALASRIWINCVSVPKVLSPAPKKETRLLKPSGARDYDNC